MSRININLLFHKQFLSLLGVTIKITCRGITARIREIHIFGIRRDIKFVWRSYLLDFLSDGFTEDSIFHLLCLRIDGLDGIDILTRIIGEFRTYGVKTSPSVLL